MTATEHWSPPPIKYWMAPPEKCSISFERGTSLEVAEAVLSELNQIGICQLIHDGRSFWRYLPEHEAWVEVDDSNLAQFIHRYSGRPATLKRRKHLPVTSQLVDRTISLIRRRVLHRKFFTTAGSVKKLDVHGRAIKEG